jgi:hypothetical protein
MPLFARAYYAKEKRKINRKFALKIYKFWNWQMADQISPAI